MYKNIGEVAEFLYGKLPNFHGNKEMERFFYHFRIWLGVIGNTWLFLLGLSGQMKGIADESFVFRLISGFGLWLGIWFIVKMASYVN